MPPQYPTKQEAERYQKRMWAEYIKKMEERKILRKWKKGKKWVKHNEHANNDKNDEREIASRIEK